MSRLDDIYRIVGAYGLGRVLPQGSTRAAAKVAIDGIIRSGKIIVPAAARAAPAAGRVALNVARANPYASAALLGYGAYEAGLLDPLIDPAQEAIRDTAEDIIIPLKKSRKRSVSGFNKAISAGMTAVRGSKWMGKKGTISNPKSAFSTVTKTVSGMKKGRKAPKSGVRKAIYRAAKRFL
tara:strand:+ start:270 stop:809 length:540 start_codon:yes stop_codon:yes gene_type:complete